MSQNGPTPPSPAALPAALAQFDVLRFTGADARAFLHGQVTCDVAGLPPGRWTWGAYCTAKGRILSNFMLWQEDDAWCLLLPAALCAGIERRLRMYVLRAKVVIAPEHPKRLALGFADTPPTGVAAPAAGTTTRQADITLLGLTGGRTLTLAPQPQVDALTPEALDPAAWDALCIRHGEPWISAATQEAFVPQMLNLERIGGVSFTKGCYPGQEIVARAQHLGEVKRRLFRYALPAGTPPSAGTSLHLPGHDDAAGIVVSAAASGAGAELLAVVQTAAASGPLRLACAEGAAIEFVAPAPDPGSG